MLTRNSRVIVTTVAIAVVVMALAFVGCSSKNKLESTTPAGAGLTVTASPSLIASGSTSVIEATLTEGGSGVADQEVTFSVSPISSGYFSPTSDTTDANGVAASSPGLAR